MTPVPASRPPRASVLRNSLLLLGSQVITWALSTIVVLLIPRVLGPADVGRYTVALGIWGIASVVIGLGTSLSVTMETARDPHRVESVMGSALRVRAITTVAAWVAVAAYFLMVDDTPRVLALAAVVGIATTIGALVDVGASALGGQERMGAIAGADVLSRVITTVVVLVVLLTRNLVAIAAAGILIPLVRGIAIRRALAEHPSPWRRATWLDARALAGRSRPFFVAGIALIVYQQVDVIALSLLVDDRQIGWYAAAINTMGTLLFGANIVMASLMPAMTRAHARHPDDARQLLGQAFDTLWLMAVPIGIATAVCAKPGIRLLLGDSFAPTASVLQILAAVVVLVHFAILFGAYAYATGRQSFWNANIALAIVLSIALDVVLVPWAERRYGNGGIGGALAYVITDSLMVVIGIAYLAPNILTRRRLHRMGRCALAGGLAMAAGWPLRSTFVIVPGVAVVVTYVAAVAVLRVPTPAEMQHLRSVLAAGQRRLGRGSGSAPDARPDPERLGVATPPLSDWALLTQIRSLDEAAATLTDAGWHALWQNRHRLQPIPPGVAAMDFRRTVWLRQLALGSLPEAPEVEPYRALAAGAHWWRIAIDPHDEQGLARRALIAFLVVDTRADEDDAFANDPPAAVRQRRVELLAQRLVERGVAPTAEQVMGLTADDLGRCLSEPAEMRVVLAGRARTETRIADS